MEDFTREADSLLPLSKAPFSDAIKNLESLLSQSNRAFLLGAGCSRCAGLPLTYELTEQVSSALEKGLPPEKILSSVANRYEGSDTATIEDFMSELVDLLSIATRRKENGAKETTIELDGAAWQVSDLQNALQEIKEKIANCIGNKTLDISTHRKFIKAVHHTLRTGKSSSIRAVDYFVLNYDTLIEDALALEQVFYTDGFNGHATGWWDESSFSANGVAARVLKLHGSIDWCLLDNDVLPRRLRLPLKFSNVVPKENVMIWPAATKYRETQRDPYAQLVALMRDSLKPRPNSPLVVTICGYRFGDLHINLEISRALYESRENLTLLVFTELDEPQGQLKAWLEDQAISAQIRVHAKNGFFHGSTSVASTEDLPWWKFENVTRLLAGERW